MSSYSVRGPRGIGDALGILWEIRHFLCRRLTDEVDGSTGFGESARVGAQRVSAGYGLGRRQRAQGHVAEVVGRAAVQGR